MPEHILIDSDYADFVPQQSKIKLLTLDKEVGGRGCLVIVLLPIALLMFAGLIQTFAHALAFRQQGVIAEGTIIKCERRGGLRSGEFMDLFYTYTVNDQIYNDSDSTDIANKCQNFPQGVAIPIQYLANDPQQSVYQEAIQPYQWGVINLFGLIVIGCIIFMGWHFKKIFRLRQQVRRLTTEGQLIQGKITHVEMKKLRRRLGVKMWYEFVNPHQFTCKGIATMEILDADEIRTADFIGSTLTVLYAADDCFVAL